MEQPQPDRRTVPGWVPVAAALVVVAVLVGIAAVATQPQQRVCTMIGCATNLVVDLGLDGGDELPDVEVCLDGTCQRTAGGELGSIRQSPVDAALWVEVDPAVFEDARGDSVDVEAVVTLFTASGTVAEQHTETVTFTASYPNGRDCPPPCWSAALEL